MKNKCIRENFENMKKYFQTDEYATTEPEPKPQAEAAPATETAEQNDNAQKLVDFIKKQINVDITPARRPEYDSLKYGYIVVDLHVFDDCTKIKQLEYAYGGRFFAIDDYNATLSRFWFGDKLTNESTSQKPKLSSFFGRICTHEENCTAIKRENIQKVEACATREEMITLLLTLPKVLLRMQADEFEKVYHKTINYDFTKTTKKELASMIADRVMSRRNNRPQAPAPVKQPEPESEQAQTPAPVESVQPSQPEAQQEPEQPREISSMSYDGVIHFAFKWKIDRLRNYPSMTREQYFSELPTPYNCAELLGLHIPKSIPIEKAFKILAARWAEIIETQEPTPEKRDEYYSLADVDFFTGFSKIMYDHDDRLNLLMRQPIEKLREIANEELITIPKDAQNIKKYFAYDLLNAIEERYTKIDVGEAVYIDGQPVKTPLILARWELMRVGEQYPEPTPAEPHKEAHEPPTPQAIALPPVVMVQPHEPPKKRGFFTKARQLLSACFSWLNV